MDAEKRTVADVYAEADAEGLYGFDVDMKLTPEQNLDMARAGFTTKWDDNNEWDVK